MYEIKRAKCQSHARVHFVTARAGLLTDRRMSGLPNRDKIQAFLDNLRAYFGQFSNHFPVLPFRTDGRPSKEVIL